MQHLLDHTTELVTTLLHYDAARGQVQSACPHHINLVCDTAKKSWCATCGKAGHTWQRYPNTTYLDIAIPERIAGRLEERPVSVPTLPEFVDLIRVYMRELSAQQDRQRMSFLIHLLEALGVEHYFISLKAQTERSQALVASTPPSS